MINRILIRIKVVQILYSYLLSRSEFKIETAPDTTSRDRKFAYAVYLDLMQLIMELSGVRTPIAGRALPAIDIEKRLLTNRVARALADNDTFRAAVFRTPSDINAFAPVMQSLHDKIVASTAFKDFKKVRNHQLVNDVQFWVVVLRTLIAKDRAVEEALRTNPDFTLAGFRKGIDMLADTLESFSDSRASYLNAQRELKTSLDKAYELYHSMFVLMIELTKEQEDRFEMAKNKYLATAEDLNPDTRFVDNAFIARLRENADLEAFLKDHPMTWFDQPTLLKNLLDRILASDIYRDYMSSPTTDYESDCEFWRNIMRLVVLPSDELAEALEDKSVYWNDDLHIMGTFVLKTIRQMAQAGGDEIEFLPQFKDEEDAEFGAELFTKAVDHREQYREYIDRFISASWDPERLAFMDIVIMIAAITEILNFPAIPVPVSLNEYIEIANSYSTQRSGAFINGTLYSIINMLKDEGKLLKDIN